MDQLYLVHAFNLGVYMCHLTITSFSWFIDFVKFVSSFLYTCIYHAHEIFVYLQMIEWEAKYMYF